ncbi:hypothetical protein SLEP1_g53974 [Rubroshorea leprosula]|uniref:Uncharacterized protein n=1 Tax=Rubroshorea leprosula TaxID=152421 RepID=A0AAV5MAY1_9ROSI|nr:hypothetical protein SLEP1_g53974 [Rubroshorea leprosula]
MENGTRKGGNVGERASISTKDDGFFSNKILSRNYSAGYSSRIYYRSPEGVPFNWEMQPGTPKDPPKEDNLPPLSPPPAILSLGLPKPCINVEEPKPPRLLRFKFWKQREKGDRTKKLQMEPKASSDRLDAAESEKYFEICSCDGEATASPPLASTSSSSSSISLSNPHSAPQSCLGGPTRDSLHGSYGCGPWKFSWVIVRAARRQ